MDIDFAEEERRQAEEDLIVEVLRVDYAYLSSTYVDKDQYEGQYLPGAVS